MTSKSLVVVVVTWLILGTSGAPAGAQSAASIESLDINSQETGDGAGCFFSLKKSEVQTYVFIERDGYGWMRLNGKLEKFRPSEEFVMWPSREGANLHRVYRSDHAEVELSIEVTTGCKDYEDNCAVIYHGSLVLTLERKKSTVDVEGYCAC